jgi:hypothetical protein
MRQVREVHPSGSLPTHRDKTLTVTNLSAARPTWLANLHAALDRAAWAAYS